MRGMNAIDGKALDGIEHLRQSVRDVLLTPIGSRVLRREYGSRILSLIDAPTNASLKIDLIAAVSDALAIWEPRIYIQKVTINIPLPGVVSTNIEGIYLPTGKPISLKGIEITSAIAPN